MDIFDALIHLYPDDPRAHQCAEAARERSDQAEKYEAESAALMSPRTSDPRIDRERCKRAGHLHNDAIKAVAAAFGWLRIGHLDCAAEKLAG